MAREEEPNPLRIARLPKPLSEMTEVELDDWCQKFVEALGGHEVVTEHADLAGQDSTTGS